MRHLKNWLAIVAARICRRRGGPSNEQGANFEVFYRVHPPSPPRSVKPCLNHFAKKLESMSAKSRDRALRSLNKGLSRQDEHYDISANAVIMGERQPILDVLEARFPQLSKPDECKPRLRISEILVWFGRFRQPPSD